MTLLGRPLEILVAVLALGLPAAAVWFWRRVRGPRAARIAQRAGLLVGSQLAAVLATAVALNHIGYFYGSWSDLFRGQLTGANITAVSTQHGQAGRTAVSPASAGHLSVGRTPSTPGSSARWARYGRLEPLAVRGAASALAVRAEVFLPPQYFQPAFRRTKFAGVEVFGAPPNGPLPRADLAGLRRLIETHRSRPTVVVVLHPSPTSPPEAACADGPTGPQRETLYARDIPSQIALAYRVEPTGWGVAGRGTGGYCAVKLAMLHPRVFTAAAAVDAYFTPPPRGHSTDPWGGSKTLRELSDLNWRLEHMPAPPIALLLTTTGGSAVAAAAAFTKRAGPPLTVRTVNTNATGQTPQLADATAWLTRQLPPARIHP